MKVTQVEQKVKTSSNFTIKDGDTPISNAHILLIAENNTFFEQHTDESGVCVFKSLQTKPFSVYVAHPSYPGYAIDNYIPNFDLEITIERSDDIGSLICANRTGYIPGLDGRLNPILDTSDRTYLYADNIAINGGENQPVTFVTGKPITLEDRNDVRLAVVFLRIKGDSSLLQYKKIEYKDSPQPSGHIKGLVIEAGGNINNSGEILADKDQFVILRSAKDVNHSGKINTLGETNFEKGFFERLTNNQTVAIIIGGLVLTIVLYLVYRYTGINLRS